MEINKDFIQVKDRVDNWEDAIRIASNPLLSNKLINKNYQDKMIENVKEMGPYIVLSEDIAMPHARPEDGAVKSAISILKLKNRISFGNNKNVNFIIALACSNDDDHIKTLQYISKILSDNDNYKALIETNDINKIYKILKKGELL